MDPNETLERLRSLVKDTDSYAGDFADAVRDLDEWLKRGGALPSAWAKPRPEQIFEVRVHCDGASLVVGRYYDCAKALGHVTLLEGREKEMALLGASGADVVPVEVTP